MGSSGRVSGAAASAQREPEDCGILPAADRLIVAAAHPDLLEADGLIQADRRRVGWAHLEERLAHAGRRPALEQIAEHAPAEPAAAIRVRNAQVEYVRFAGTDTHYAVADDLTPHAEHAADIPDPQAIAKDALTPGELVGGTLDGEDLGDVRLRHGADADLRGSLEQLRSDGHLRTLPSVAGTRYARTSGPPTPCACPPDCAGDRRDDTSPRGVCSARRTGAPGHAAGSETPPWPAGSGPLSAPPRAVTGGARTRSGAAGRAGRRPLPRGADRGCSAAGS